MCFPDDSFPFILPVAVTATRSGTKHLTVSLLLGKVTTLRHGEHISFRGLRYPLRQPVHDTMAIPGSHDYALHFAATPACTIGLPDEFGSHRLAVLPSPQLWDPFTEQEENSRCWHSDSCIPLFCMDCWQLQPTDLNNPDFWRAFQKRREHADGSLLRIPLEQIWHRQLAVVPTREQTREEENSNAVV
jgi:hypothetical protein